MPAGDSDPEHVVIVCRLHHWHESAEVPDRYSMPALTRHGVVISRFTPGGLIGAQRMVAVSKTSAS